MKKMLASLRGIAAVLAASLTISTTAHAAPKKPEPAPVASPAPVSVWKGMYNRSKALLGLKKKEQPAAAQQAPVPDAGRQPAPKAKPAAAPAPAKKTAAAVPAAPVKQKKSPPVTAAAPAPAKKPAVAAVPAAPVKQKKSPPVTAAAEPAPAKKSWLKRLNPWSKSEAPAEPSLANARTARPAPVKAAKPAASAALPPAPEPGEKRGLAGFFRKLREPLDDTTSSSEVARIERPADWEEHKVVTQNGIGIYSFGPTQANGPDKRLPGGTVVKLKEMRRGWALVEVNGNLTGFIDPAALRPAAKEDFNDPPPPPTPTAVASAFRPENWSPIAPPPDLPDQPSAMDADSALLLLPPLLEPKPNP